VVHKGKPSSRRNRFSHPLDNNIWSIDWKRNLDHDNATLRALGNKIKHVARSVVFVIANDEFVTLVERHRTQDRVQGFGHVGNKGQVFRVRANERAKTLARSRKSVGCLATQERTGLIFELALHAVEFGEHHLRTGAERTMIDVRDFRVE
jgi:hypothetical protein